MYVPGVTVQCTYLEQVHQVAPDHGLGDVPALPQLLQGLAAQLELLVQPAPLLPAEVKVFRCSGVQVCRCAGVQVFRCSGVCRCSGGYLL